ncbi:Tfp pilus assembly protein PilN [Pelomonas saccharophila]|uniref:Tfp pilus assembly protein PilN n=1 Tax=Roseateles saccharophilus TaxID=304 RepID=A0ABU1YF64_ROSSA|nr:PilN domain-containing protein [Roseateles saccharophilus]MDR7267504.1 Tfp pilus assembly protein PilN [Roseateles saccharophilus]
MAQQINLLTPILLAPKRYFSALTLVQATGLLLVAGLAAALWLQQRDRSAEAQHQALLAQYTTERQQLAVAQAGLPAPLDAATVQQQLLPLTAGNADLRALLKVLGVDTAGQHHSDLLALLATTLPESAWLTELRYTPGRVELVGGTLDTAVLRPWLARLASHPLLAGQELSALRVERLGAPGTQAGGDPLLSRGSPLMASGLPVWAFRVVSAPAQAASAAPGVAR